MALIALAASGPQEAATLVVTGPVPSEIKTVNPELTLSGANLNVDVEDSSATESMPVAPPAPRWHEETVRSGDNLSLIFARAGYTDRDVYQVTRADGGKALRRIYPGETVAFLTDESDRLAAVRHTESRLKSTTFVKGDQGFVTEVLERKPEVRERGTRLRITSSLFLAGSDAGLSNRVIMDLAGIFGGVIDFVLDPRVGDTIELVYEEEFLDGEKLRDGDIVAASFTNKGERFEAYRYTDSAGDTSYYNEDGVSMRKAFLMAPVDFTRISSNFNPNRLHPIYKTKRPHRGTDYAAPRGTPVYSAGDGRVVEAGYTRANGNYVFIQHGESYKTHYLHLHKRKVKRGDRVSQGSVIGTVGSTGAATGPHLHYEFLVNGVHRNPRSVHKMLPKAKSLPGGELPVFRSHIAAFDQQLAALRSETKLALSD
ncbi:3'-5' exoribonuclease, VacB and RNase II [Luminiphilus syltensis NOR5-1B]|uniref:3'-5' exoribonuclease, VacB and RNase II n=1 Tax=Luminiphilus syltensis NOR5-1B TaxID=565045 RepID=B8KW23_9GAMM|nr:3'-5' exoribonuclease, VacB and RNase II [Luminiphilus syltensis NOR5-1B]